MKLIPVICIFSLISGSFATVHLKILLKTPETTSSGSQQDSLTKRALNEKNDNCLAWQFQKVAKSDVHLPWKYRKIIPPWNYHSDSGIYSSKSFEKDMNTLLQLKVHGINSSSLQVFEILTANGCMPIIWGGAIRDTILKIGVHDVDAEVSCDFEVLDSVCRKQWGNRNCKKRSSFETLMIGNVDSITEEILDVVDVGLWDHTFYENETKWEYTTNSLGYYLPVDSQPGYLLDMTSTGLADTCDHQIKIPVQLALWEDWFQESFLCKKVFRAWKLRYKNFTFFDNNTAQFIINKAKWCIDKNPKQFIDFYCGQTLGVNNDSNLANVLSYGPPYQVCNQSVVGCAKLDKFLEYSKLYRQDLGDDVYEKYVQTLVSSHSAICLQSNNIGKRACQQTFNATSGKTEYSCQPDPNAECTVAVYNYGQEWGFLNRSYQCSCKVGFSERKIFTRTKGYRSEQVECIPDTGVVNFDCNGTTYPCGAMGANFGIDNYANRSDDCFCTQIKDVDVWAHCTNATFGRPCFDKNAICIGKTISESKCVCKEGYYHDYVKCVKLPEDAIYFECNKIYPISHVCSGSDMNMISFENGQCYCFKNK